MLLIVEVTVEVDCRVCVCFAREVAATIKVSGRREAEKRLRHYDVKQTMGGRDVIVFNRCLLEQKPARYNVA